MSAMNPRSDNEQPQASQANASQAATGVEGAPHAANARLAWLVPESKKTLVAPLCPEVEGPVEAGRQDAPAYDGPAMEGNA